MANHCFHANLATGPKLNLLKFFSLDQNQIRGQSLVMKVLACRPYRKESEIEVGLLFFSSTLDPNNISSKRASALFSGFGGVGGATGSILIGSGSGVGSRGVEIFSGSTIGSSLIGAGEALVMNGAPDVEISSVALRSTAGSSFGGAGRANDELRFCLDF